MIPTSSPPRNANTLNSLAPPAGSTATSFDFYGKTKGYVTPLIFNYNAGTYTLTGIGKPFNAGEGSQGTELLR